MQNKLVTVRTYETPIKANMALSFLETEGIDGFLEGEETLGMIAYSEKAIQGIKLQVNQDEVERASIILDLNRPLYPEAIDNSEVDFRDEFYFEENREKDVEVESLKVEGENEIVERAFRAMAFGLRFFPISFYSLYLMGTVDWASESLTEKNKKRIPIIMLVNVCVVVCFMSIFIALFLM